MTDDPERQAVAAHLAAEGARAQAAAAVEVADREARRAEILARYGNEAAALAPCLRERDLVQATWQLVVRGDPETGPSLMGWRDGLAETLPPEVLREVSAAVRAPVTFAEWEDEDRYWQHRAEVHAVLGGPGLPVWVRARRAFLALRFETLSAFTPPGEDHQPPAAIGTEGADAEEDAAHEPNQAPEAGTPSPAPEIPAPAPKAHRSMKGAAPAETKGTAPADEQPPRTRAEARAAVQALLGEGLTNREIARRVGVSPSTVASVRQRPA